MNIYIYLQVYISNKLVAAACIYVTPFQAINSSSPDVTMLDLDDSAEQTTFFDTLYGIDGNDE